MKNDHPELSDLIQACLDGRATDEQITGLNAQLRSDAAARDLYLQLADTHSCLAVDESLWMEDLADARAPEFQARQGRERWLNWQPIAAAATGIVFGMFCTSVVFAYVAPSAGKVNLLLKESFESGPAPLMNGVPMEPNKWSGDYSEVVGEQQGVKPENGKRMLRFLRGDYEGKGIPSSHSSDVFRLVDVRPYRREFADSGAVVQLSAVFNAAPFPEDETFNATLTLFALDVGLVGNEVVKGENVLSADSLAFSRSSRVAMDRDPTTWQKVSNELRLPPGTEFLMIRMGMSNDTKSKDKRRDSFAGHFADTVQLVIARRPEIPVP